MRIWIIVQRKPGGKVEKERLSSREEIQRYVRNHKLGINDYSLFANGKLIKDFKDKEYVIKEETKMRKTLNEDNIFTDSFKKLVLKMTAADRQRIKEIKASIQSIAKNVKEIRTMRADEKKYRNSSWADKIKDAEETKKGSGKTIKDDILNNYKFLNNEKINEAREVKLDPRDVKNLKVEVRKCLWKFESTLEKAYGEDEPSREMLRAMAKRKMTEVFKEIQNSEDLRITGLQRG